MQYNILAVTLAAPISLMCAPVGVAQERITLAEVVPSIAGTTLANIELGDAPPPGTSRAVRPSEVRGALRQAGYQEDAVTIPSPVRVHRESRTLSAETVQELVTPSFRSAISVCEVETVEVTHTVKVGAGQTHVRAEVMTPRNSGKITGVAIIETNGREQRIPVRVSVQCPEAVIHPGSSVRILAIVGNVRASAQGEARQAGRIGDVIRVRNHATDSMLTARVVDDRTVEVVR